MQKRKERWFISYMDMALSLPSAETSRVRLQAPSMSVHAVPVMSLPMIPVPVDEKALN